MPPPASYGYQYPPMLPGPDPKPKNHVESTMTAEEKAEAAAKRVEDAYAKAGGYGWVIPPPSP